MFTNPEWVVSSQIDRRYDYVTDANGSHAKAALKPEILLIHRGRICEELPTEFFLKEAKGRSLRTGKRGCPKTYLGVEFVARPARVAKAPLTRAEAKWFILRVVEELGIREAVVALHGLQDIHFLALNFSITGHALRHLFPGKSRPRRVLAAVGDRLERELNEKRAVAKLPQFETMAQARARKNPDAGKMWAMIAGNLPSQTRPPTIQEILLAVAACGWLPKGGKRLFIRFKKGQSAKGYDWDLVFRNIRDGIILRRERPHEFAKKKNQRRGARPPSPPDAKANSAAPAPQPELSDEEIRDTKPTDMRP